jgi:hypothetical protein
MTQALNLALFANKLNTSGQTDNTGLQNSTVTVTAGTGMSGGGSAALGSSVTLTNAGVTSIVAGTGITVSGSTGAVTVNASGSYAGISVQSFTASGTFTVPTGITRVKVSVAGGGGGGGGINNGGNGGTSSFGSFVIGGGGGFGGRGFDNGTECTTAANGTTAASTNIPYGYSNLNLTRSPDYGTGGNGGSGGSGCGGNSGLNGGRGVGYVTGLTPGASITVTIGAGGTSGTGSGTTAGVAGAVVIEW